jgi:ActR/RegA family two-component response regulator
MALTGTFERGMLNTKDTVRKFKDIKEQGPMGVNLLVVDDDSDILDVIKQAFIPSGYNIDSTNSIGHALELMVENEYDVLITDKNIPSPKNVQEGGMELLQQVRQRHPATEVIMITGYATIDTAIEAMKLGAFDYLSKPFPIKFLIEKVERIVSLKRFLNPNSTLGSFKAYHNDLLGLFENTDRCFDEKAIKSIKSILSKLDDFFRVQKERERIMIEQREALAKIASNAEELCELLAEKNESYDLLNRICEFSNRRL